MVDNLFSHIKNYLESSHAGCKNDKRVIIIQTLHLSGKNTVQRPTLYIRNQLIDIIQS